MLFSNIHTLLLRGVTLNLILAAAGDDKIEVTVLPNSEKSTAGSQLVAKTFVATPQELDVQFPGVMAGYASANLTLQDQLEAVQKQAQAVAAAAAEAAQAQAVKKPAGPSSSSLGKKAAAKPSLMNDDDEEDASGAGDGETGNDSTVGAALADARQPQLISL